MEDETISLRGIDQNWVADILIGIAAGVVFMILKSIAPGIGAIGIPSVPQAIAGNIGRFLIIVVVASIAEEFFFREFVLDFFDDKLKGFGLDPSYFIAALISSVAFALFHFSAYSSSLSAAGGSFISAAIAGMCFAYIRKFTNSNIGNIMTHATINFLIIAPTLVVIG